MKKKVLTLILAAALLCSFCPLQIGFAATAAAPETKLVNVAKNKAVVAASGGIKGSPGNVNDDDWGTRWIGPAELNLEKVKPTLTFDLLRRYPVEKIIIFDNVSDETFGNVTSLNRGQFEIWGSDTLGFTEKKLLFELDIPSTDASLAAVFPAGGEYIISLADKPAYRYIRYISKEFGYCNIKEIQMWAELNATEVSRSCMTYTTPNLDSEATNGSCAVDGKMVRDNGYYGTKVDATNYPGYFSTFTVDLESAKHIGMIEIYGRRKIINSYADGFFTLYGSNTAVTDFTQSAAEGLAAYGALPKADFVKLGYTPLWELNTFTKEYLLANTASELDIYPRYSTVDGITKYAPYPTFTDDAPYGYNIMINPQTPYRYITHRKTNANLAAQFGEFRAYELNPDAYGLENVTKTGATINFSDFNMDAASLTTANIKALDSTDNEVAGAITGITLAANGADAEVSFDTTKLAYGGDYKISVGTNVKNSYGTPLASEKALSFKYPEAFKVENVSLPTFTSGADNTFSFKLANQTDTAKNILAVIALYEQSGEQLVNADVDMKQVAADGNAVEFSVTANAVAESMKIFIWDADTLTPIAY